MTIRPYLQLLIIPAVFVLDRVTKSIIVAKVTAWDNFPVIPGLFSIVHTRNRGAAFGFLNESDSPWRGVVLIGVASIVMGMVATMLWQSFRSREPQSAWLRAGLALVLGGAAGNMFDRVTAGSVTDFLLFYWGDAQFPAFNVADSAITAGACCLFIDMLRTKRPAVTGSAEALNRKY